MRMTLNLDEDLLRRAISVTKLPSKTAVIELGLRELLGRVARQRLAALYGSDPGAKVPTRRR
jgi:Arc/MetJ family transcription regulator